MNMTTRPEGRVVFAGKLCCSGRAQDYNPSVSFADTSLYTREAIRCGGDGPMRASAPTRCRRRSREAGGRGRPPLRGAVRGSLRKIHEYSLVYTAKVWYSETQQWRSILVGPTGIGEGPKNPLKGISMKPVVSASYAQSGVDAGGRHFFACGGRASPNGMGSTDPAAVETGYCAEAYSLCGQRPLYGTGLNLHCGATRLRAVNAVCSVACLA